ncbi:hypothetical protein [Clostridium fallax]|uniref:Uncharacterized protein n=1 Tax=Clostridium fallax TaxID=1533 RepID=A0A1M4SU67_9CLOT|nr:hypothetical protein [Clostridium fallax]SHE35780.1 hypothetical protein SAMN05443638_101180 [Clostridium fallax]SQB07976.1 Uncharacterised protein [Clostridium fallax]
MDQFKEQLVLVSNKTPYNMAKALMMVFFVIAMFFLVLGGAVFSIVFFVVSGAIWYLKRYFYVEYEYALTNGEIDIDAIYEMKKRKRQVTFNLKEVALLAPKDSDAYRDFSNKPTKIIKSIPTGNTERVYVAILTEGLTRAQIEFVPNKAFIDACFIFNPKAIKKNL